MKRSNGGIVIEIGSGHSPCFGSDILVDKDISESREREGPLRLDCRPLVCAVGEALPFKSKAAARVHAYQVLEHSDDPEAFISEAHRVGDIVYLETPSPLTERLFHWRSFHRWYCWLDAGELVVWRRGDYPTDGLVDGPFEEFYKRNRLVWLFVRSNPQLFLTRYLSDRPLSVRFGSSTEFSRALEANVQSIESGVGAVSICSALVRACAGRLGTAPLPAFVVDRLPRLRSLVVKLCYRH